MFRNQCRKTHFLPQKTIFVDSFGAETQAFASTTLWEQKGMEMIAVRPDMTKPFNDFSPALNQGHGLQFKLLVIPTSRFAGIHGSFLYTKSPNRKTEECSTQVRSNQREPANFKTWNYRVLSQAAKLSW
ncbi:MAG: hypothetical protein ABSE48_11260 [Verrucomicrobiota bacterium]